MLVSTLSSVVPAVLAGAAAAGFLGYMRIRGMAARQARLEGELAAAQKELESSTRTLNEALAAIENENFTDPLTDLRNRRYISAVIKADMAKVQRTYRDALQENAAAGPLPNQDLIFLMVDLDHFSRINEFYGAPLGDQVLQSVAQALRRVVRETDAVIRWGGEEFLVVARNASRKEAPEIAERIRASVANLLAESPKGELLHWTCCIGFAAYPFQTTDFGWLLWDRVVEITEACVETAKRSGRNAWVGVQARPGLDRARHGHRFPKELAALAEEGVLEVVSSRDDPFGKSQKIGEILG